FRRQQRSLAGLSPLSLHDALPISSALLGVTTVRPAQLLSVTGSRPAKVTAAGPAVTSPEPGVVPLGAYLTAAMGVPVTASESARSEEHTSELQSLTHLVCRLLLSN